MPRANYRDAIFQAISDINTLGSLGELSTTAVKQGIVLRILSAAGWNAFDLSEVEPEFRTGNTRMDFALKSSGSVRSREPSTPKVFVEVRSIDDNLESERYERQLVANCSREDVSLGVLTNGPRWLLFYTAPGEERRERQFCDATLTENADEVAEEFSRYLSKERVSSGQAERSAERALQDRNRGEIARKAILDGWRQVVGGLDEGLVELVATAAEQRTGDRPENRFIRRTLVESRSELLMTVQDDVASLGTGAGSGSRRRPASFTFDSETQTVSSWPDLLVGLCSLIGERHPGEFEKILEIRGRTLPYFSRNEQDLHLPREIGGTGIHASCQGAGVLIEARAQKVLELFGYPRESLAIRTR